MDFSAKTHQLVEGRKKVFALDAKGQVQTNPQTGEQITKEISEGTFAKMDVLDGDKKVGEVIMSLHECTEEQQEFFRSCFQKAISVRFGV